MPSSQNTLQAAERDPLQLAIPEATGGKMMQGWCTSSFRNTLFRIGCCVAHYDSKYVRPDGALLREVATLLETGKVRAVVLPENVHPLEQVAAACHKVALGHVRGKVVLVI